MSKWNDIACIILWFFSYYEKKQLSSRVIILFQKYKIVLHGKMSVNYERFLFIILRTKLKNYIKFT